jgi:mRNA-degrading endonuclease RelE of RelBE toxin-antitoxin system
VRYNVIWTQSAVDDLGVVFASQPRDGQRVILTTRMFGRDGHGDLKKLQGKLKDWRLRTGKWRVLVTLDNDTALVTKVDDRKDAY